MAASTTGIGHTRWATHGGPTDINAHPHVSSGGRVAVIHNGIIENFAELTAELAEGGIVMASETDTEVVAHLLESTLADTGDLADAMRAACRRLSGAFTLVAVSADEPGRLVAARRNSPLVVGIGEGENFLASDVSAFIAFTRNAIELGQDQVVDLTADKVIVTDFAGAAGGRHPVHRHLGRLGGGEGRLRPVHAQGDRRAAQGRGGHAPGPDRPGRAAPPRRDPAPPG